LYNYRAIKIDIYSRQPEKEPRPPLAPLVGTLDENRIATDEAKNITNTVGPGVNLLVEAPHNGGFIVHASPCSPLQICYYAIAILQPAIAILQSSVAILLLLILLYV